MAGRQVTLAPPAEIGQRPITEHVDLRSGSRNPELERSSRRNMAPSPALMFRRAGRWRFCCFRCPSHPSKPRALPFLGLPNSCQPVVSAHLHGTGCSAPPAPTF